jgi:hypothetical protein
MPGHAAKADAELKATARKAATVHILSAKT